MRVFIAFICGFLLAGILAINAFEWLHLEIEVEGHKDFCGLVWTAAEHRAGMSATQKIKIVYKFFSHPMRTLYVYLNPKDHDEFVVTDKGTIKRGVFKGVFEDGVPPRLDL